MRERPASGQVIITFTEHPIFGILLIPYIMERLDDDTLRLVEQAFHASPEAMSKIGEAKRQAIHIAFYYTEKHLMSVYSREEVASRFLHKLSGDPERIKNDIRPSIEKRLLEMSALIRDNGLPFYQKQVGSKILYAHHTHHINPHNAEIRITFHVDNRAFRHQLQCHYGEQPFSLNESKPVAILISALATLLLGMKLYLSPHTGSARILPFTKKRSIGVNASQIEKHIDNIVVLIIRYHEIETHGLGIMEKKCPCKAILSFKDTTYNGRVLQLGFRYGNQTLTSDSTLEIKKIIYRKTPGGTFFFYRNITAKEQAVQFLTDAGLRQLNDTYFNLSPEAPEKTIVEWINNHQGMLQWSFHLTSNMGNTPYCLDETRIEQSCSDGIDWSELRITVVIGNLRIPFSRFRKHILEEKREYLLPGGHMIFLPEEWLGKYASLLEMGIQMEKGIRLKHTFVGATQAALGKEGLKKFPVK